jgi:hypothetical protein
LKFALEQLLGAPCYHMMEVLEHLDSVPNWTAAAEGKPVDWDAVFNGYAATVDWPGASFWPELTEAMPDALVVLSVRESAEAWWKSASETIFAIMERGEPPAESGMVPWFHMVTTMFSERFTTDITNRDAAIAAYEAHNARVRATVPPDRLLEWKPGDGWAPLCDALSLPVPPEPFPHVNSTAEFRAMTGLDAPV